MKGNKIIGRKDELNRLRRYYNSGKAEFVAIYGRRRVGKTYLVDTCFDKKYDFYMSGVIEGSFDEQLYAFNKAYQEYGGTLPLAKNWTEAFENLRSLLEPHIDKERLLIFIDELPCLDTPRSGFTTALDLFWNTWASKHDNVKFIVCGSATSWIIENIIDSHGGLHNRITHEMHISPFCLHEVEEFLVDNGFHWDRLTIAQCYMTMGGIPYYLGLLESQESLAQNIDRLFFSPYGELRHEYDRLFHALFRKPEKYLKVIEILARKRKGLTRNEIIQTAKTTSGEELTKILRNLEYCDFIRSYSTTGDALASNNRAYQITDLFTLFYLKFCKQSSSDAHWWSHNLGKSIQNDWYGIMFEVLCVLHIIQIKMALGIEGIHSEYAGWRSKTDTKAQIDLLIDRADGMVSVCEMKYSKGLYSLSKTEAEKLSRRTTIYRQEANLSKGLQTVLVTTWGLKPNKYSSSIDRTVCLDDLYMLPRS